MAAELTESQINGRFHVLERPAALPGKCAVCGSVQKPVVDFGMTIQFYGTIYICQECLTEAAGLMGMVPVEKYEAAQLVQRQYLERGNKLNEMIEGYTNVLRHTAVRLNCDISDLLNSPVDVSEVSAPAVEVVPDLDGADIIEESATVGQESKPSRKSRSTSVPADSSDESGTIFPI